MLAFPAAAEDVTVRNRDDGRVDVRATAAPLAVVLGRLAALTDMKVAYQGPPPGRLVTLEVSAASQAEAVRDVLERSGADYAAGTDSAGTRVLTLVVADTPAGGQPDPEAAASEPAPAPDAEPPEPPDPLPSADTTPPDTSEVGRSGAGGHASTEGFPLLPGTFIPGVRATGQTTEWGVPDFVLPDPPGPKATAPGGTVGPSDPAADASGTGSPPSP